MKNDKWFKNSTEYQKINRILKKHNFWSFDEYLISFDFPENYTLYRLSTIWQSLEEKLNSADLKKWRLMIVEITSWWWQC